MRRPRRLIAVAAIVLLLAATVAAAWGAVFYRPLPIVDGELRILGLHERGEVLRDRFGVPHVFAADDHDLYFLQGYVTAQDRLWQMDVYRRAAEGRLAEIFGTAALESDEQMRTIGLARASALDLAALSDVVRAGLAAYADGVNAFIAHQESLPAEFVILGYRPEPWTSLDSIAVAKLQLYDAAGNYTEELLRADIAERLGLEALGVLMPDPTSLSYDRAAWDAVASELSPGARSPAALAEILGGAGEGLGSNCWALAGSRTKAGGPLLAGDPHLPVRNPSIWYEIALTDDQARFVGFSIPGAPGVVIGHNDHVAWSFTYAYAPTQQLFVERADPRDPRRFEYRGAYEPATYVRESIRVKGSADPVVIDVAITRHGPIITPIVPGEKAQLALRWTALDATRTFDAIFAIDRARTWDEFRAGAAQFGGAVLSACYADTAGHIGYLLTGQLPDRPGDGRLPVPGWTGEHDWRGLLPASANHAVLDPPEGFVLNANDRPMTSSSEAGWNGEWDPGFRYTFLRGMLDPLHGADAAAVSRLQDDYTSLPVDRFRGAILSATPATAAGRQAQEAVRAWSGALAADSVGAAIYEDWLVQLARLVFADKLGETTYKEYLAHGRPIVALYALMPDRMSASPWLSVLGDPAVAGRDAVAGAALDAAARDLERRLGADSSRWRWGDLHTITFEHPLSAQPPLDRIFTVAGAKRAGDGYSPNNGAYSMAKPFAAASHPSERQIVDLGDIDASLSITPIGESGQPFSRHWGDQTALWADGRLKPMPLSRDRLGPLEGILVLRPR